MAKAKPTIGTRADAKCLAEAAKTVKHPGFNPSNYTFHGGTEDDNNFEGQATAGPDVFCGFGGDDFIRTLDEGDIFLGGAGNDTVRDSFGTAYGQGATIRSSSALLASSTAARATTLSRTTRAPSTAAQATTPLAVATPRRTDRRVPVRSVGSNQGGPGHRAPAPYLAYSPNIA